MNQSVLECNVLECWLNKFCKKKRNAKKEASGMKWVKNGLTHFMPLIFFDTP